MTIKDIGQPLPDGSQTAGVVGTSVLRHFLSTLDFPGQALELAEPGAARLPRGAPAVPGRLPRGALTVPGWLSSRHYIAVRGSLNGYGPVPFLLDTGSPVGILPSPETVQRAGIALDPSQGLPATGCGGTTTVIPFAADEVRVGPAVGRGVPGTANFFTGPVLTSEGFTMAAAVSHAFFRPYATTLDFTAMRVILR